MRQALAPLVRVPVPRRPALEDEITSQGQVQLFTLLEAILEILEGVCMQL